MTRRVEVAFECRSLLLLRERGAPLDLGSACDAPAGFVLCGTVRCGCQPVAVCLGF
jgi:hypothetical protein